MYLGSFKAVRTSLGTCSSAGAFHVVPQKVSPVQLGGEGVHLPASWGRSTALWWDRSSTLKTRHTGTWMCRAPLQNQTWHGSLQARMVGCKPCGPATPQAPGERGAVLNKGNRDPGGHQPWGFGLPYLVPGTTPTGAAAGGCALVLALGCASSVWKEQQLRYNINGKASKRTHSLPS